MIFWTQLLMQWKWHLNCFSIYLFSEDKASLGMEALEAQVRIRMNGPPYYSLNIDPYTEFYLAPDINKRRCDKTATPNKKKYSLNQDEYDNLPTTPAKYSGIYWTECFCFRYGLVSSSNLMGFLRVLRFPSIFVGLVFENKSLSCL